MVKEWSLSDIEADHQKQKLVALKARLGKPPSWWPEEPVTGKVTEIEVRKEGLGETVVRTVDQRDDRQMWGNKEAGVDVL